MLEPYVGFKVAIRRNWRRSSDKYVLKKKIEWSLKCIFKTSTRWRKKKWCASSRWAIPMRSWAWACHPYGVHGYVKMRRIRSSPIVDYGGALARLHQASTIKKGVPSCCGQDRHHQAQVGCGRLRFSLDRVSFLPVSWFSWETGL